MLDKKLLKLKKNRLHQAECKIASNYVDFLIQFF